MLRRSLWTAAVLLLTTIALACSGGDDGNGQSGESEPEQSDARGGTNGQSSGGGGQSSTGDALVFADWAGEFCSAYSKWDLRLSAASQAPQSSDVEERSRWAANFAAEIVEASGEFVEELRAIDVPRDLIPYHYEVDSWVESEQLSIQLYVDDPGEYPLDSSEDIDFFLEEVAYWAENLEESAVKESRRQSASISAAFHAALDSNPDCVSVPRSETVTVATPQATPQSEFPFAEVPFFSCAPILSEDAIDTALDLDERVNASTFILEQGESCTVRVADDEDYFVSVRPSHPDDFAPGATVSGVEGSPVAGLGDAALWFGGSDTFSGGAAGSLSVAKETPLGTLAFRIVLGRPDLDSAAQLEVARRVAEIALDRFPGAESSPLPVVEIDRTVPDRSSAGYVENLLAREARGEWTLGQGLVATLAMLVGEAAPDEVLRDLELIDFPAPVIELANEYITLGDSDQVAVDEIERLLARLVPPYPGDPAAAVSSAGVPSTDRSFAVAAVTQEGSSNCADDGRYFDDPDVCWETRTPADASAEDLSPFILWAPAPSAAGWTNAHADVMFEAGLFSRQVLADLGLNVPPTDVVLGNTSALYARDIVAVPDDVSQELGWSQRCVSYFGGAAQQLMAESPALLQQLVAFSQARCAIGAGRNFPDGTMADQWFAGGSWFFSDWVYPEAQLEGHMELPGKLATYELDDSLLEFEQLSWAFLEHLGSPDRVIEVLETPSGTFAGDEGISDDLHRYAERLSDAVISDTRAPHHYGAPDIKLTISAPSTHGSEIVEFGTLRLEVTVEGGEFACVDFPSSNGRTSWGTGGGDWTEALPNFLSGTSTFVATSVRATRFEIQVTDIVEDQFDCQEDLGDAGGPDFDFCRIGVCDPSQYFGNWKLR